MISLLNACKNHDNLSSLQIRFQTLLPLVEMHARSALRKVACAHAREDMVTDVVTCAWEALVHLSEVVVIVSLDAAGHPYPQVRRRPRSGRESPGRIEPAGSPAHATPVHRENPVPGYGRNSRGQEAGRPGLVRWERHL